MLLVCIMSHQAKLIEVCKHPPGINISQPVPHLQVCQRCQKHLKTTERVTEIICFNLCYVANSLV